MRRLVIAAIVLAGGFAVPAFAGPSVGSTHFHAGTYGAHPVNHKVMAPYALKGRESADEAGQYRWRAEHRQIGSRESRMVFVREAVR